MTDRTPPPRPGITTPVAMPAATSTSTHASTRAPMQIAIEGIAFWSDHLPGWDIAAAAFRGERAPLDEAAPRPAPTLLPAAERRRAPDTVALGLEVAARALADSGRPATEVASVFASAHGDLGIADYLCATLAEDPGLMSPVKFHNSVHNAVSGYWGIATGCMRASTSVAAFEHTFAAGLLEALAQVHATDDAVLLAACDIRTVGPLAQLAHSDGRMAVALVLAPAARSPAGLRLSVTYTEDGPPTAVRPSPTSPAGEALAGNALADAIPFLEWLAQVQTPIAGRTGPGRSAWLPLGPAAGACVGLYVEVPPKKETIP